MRIAIILVALLLSGSATANDLGQQWFNAMKRGSGSKAAKISVAAGLRYGVKGQNSMIATKIGKHYNKVFRKIRRMFKKAEIKKLPCSVAGRELGWMSQEWRESNRSLADWIRKIPEDFCTGTTIEPPKVWMVKVLADDLPHAIILFDTTEDDKINGFFHF
jgi:hypothetical protein